MARSTTLCLRRVAIELLHNAFLVHDDIEDASLLRRGEPTLHRRYGTPLALNAGDGLALQAMATLRENIELLGPRLADRIMVEFDFMSQQTVAGQALELGWCRDNRIDLEPDDYLDLIMKKTCWYTTVLPLRVGALVGSRGTADARSDDRVRLPSRSGLSDPRRHPQPRRGPGRLRQGAARATCCEGKRTLMLIHLLASADPADRRWLVAYLAERRPQRQPDDVGPGPRADDVVREHRLRQRVRHRRGPVRPHLHGRRLRRPRRHPRPPLHRTPRAVHDRACLVRERSIVLESGSPGRRSSDSHGDSDRLTPTRNANNESGRSYVCSVCDVGCKGEDSEISHSER